MTIADDIAAQESARSARIMRNILLTGATVLITLVLMALSGMAGGYASGGGSGGAGPGTIASVQSRLSPVIILHLATVIPAIPLGAFVLWSKKGNARHKMLGKVWASLMLITAVTSLFIGRPGTGLAGTGFSFIHIFSVVVLISIPRSIWRIRNGNVAGHQRSMQGVYIGLILAGLFSFLPGRILGILAFA